MWSQLPNYYFHPLTDPAVPSWGNQNSYLIQEFNVNFKRKKERKNLKNPKKNKTKKPQQTQTKEHHYLPCKFVPSGQVA